MSQVESFVGYSVAVLIVIYLFARLVCRSARWPVEVRQAAGFDSERQSTAIGRNLHGVEPIVVASFPTVKHDPANSLRDNFCAICLEEYEGAEILRILPWCTHAFHIDCIDKWFGQNSTCPICRISPLSAMLQPSPALRLQSSPEMILSPGSSIRSYQFASGDDSTPAAIVASRANGASVFGGEGNQLRKYELLTLISHVNMISS